MRAWMGTGGRRRNSAGPGVGVGARARVGRLTGLDWTEAGRAARAELFREAQRVRFLIGGGVVGKRTLVSGPASQQNDGLSASHDIAPCWDGPKKSTPPPHVSIPSQLRGRAPNSAGSFSFLSLSLSLPSLSIITTQANWQTLFDFSLAVALEALKQPVRPCPRPSTRLASVRRRLPLAPRLAPPPPHRHRRPNRCPAKGPPPRPAMRTGPRRLPRRRRNAACRGDTSTGRHPRRRRRSSRSCAAAPRPWPLPPATAAPTTSSSSALSWSTWSSDG